MKVPTLLNPRTSAPNLSVQGIGSAGNPTAGAEIAQGIGRLAEGLRVAFDKKKQDQKNLDKFELQQTFLDEVNVSTIDFNTAVEQAPPGAPNFAETYAAQLTAKHGKLLEEMRGFGYEQDELQDFELKLTTLRTNQLGNALKYQNEAERVQAGVDLDKRADSYSQYHLANPSATNSIKEAWDEDVNLRPHLDATEREAFRERGWNKIRTVGAEALTASDPALVAKALDPQGIYAKQLGEPGGVALVTPTSSTVAPALTVQGLREHVVAQESSGNYKAKNKETGALGRYQVMPQTGKVLAGRAGLPWRPELMTKDTPEAIAYQDKIGDAAIQDSINAGKGDPAAIFSHYYSGSASAYKNPRGNPKTAKYVEDMLKRVTPANAPAVEVNLSTTYAQPSQFDTAFAGGVPEEVAVAPSEPMQHKTGIPALDVLTGGEQLALLQRAYSVKREDLTEARAKARVEHENRNAAYAQGKDPGPNPYSDEEGEKLFGATGWQQMKGEQAANKAGGEFMVGMTTVNEATLNQRVDALKPVMGSPTYAIDIQKWQAARKAADANLELRDRDPAAYVFGVFPRVRTQLANADTPEKRKAAYRAIDAAYDQLGTPENKRHYATLEGLKTIANKYATAAPEQKLAMLEGYLSEMGARAGRTLGAAGHGEEVNKDYSLYSILRPLPGYKQTMERVLAGRDIINKDPARKPNPKAMSQAYITEVASAVNNLGGDYSRLLNETAAALYVKDGGLVEDGVVDEDKYRAALREALGGKANDEDTGIVDFGHGKAQDWTILPIGVNRTQFENWTDRLGMALGVGELTRLSVDGSQPVDGTGRPISSQGLVDNGVFVQVAPGYYGIKSALDGKPVISSKNGKPFMFRLDKARMGLR